MKKVLIAIVLLGLSTVGCSNQQFVIPPQEQSFPQSVTYNNKVDVLVMIDNSLSMDLYQNRLAAQAGSMIDTLNSYSMDYQIAVVTSDIISGGNGGRFLGTGPKFLTATTADLKSLLQTRIKAGTNGHDVEQGMASIKRVLSPTYLAGEGKGFLREDALLAIIALTSEDDNSVGNINDDIAFFNQLKPPGETSKQNWVLNFIGVDDLDSVCSSSTTTDYKEPGVRWIELAKHSGGKIESICESSLGVAANNIRARIVQIMTDFYLDREPLLDSVSVLVNGVVVPKDNINGWQYFPQGNYIRFNGTAVPKASDRININYKPASAT
jgi:hypothetical protein